MGIAGLASVFLAGPRISVDPTFRQFEVPEDIDAYLRESEAAYEDITPGTEKVIIWADSTTRARTPVSIVYFHGLSATRQEVAPLPELVAGELAANLFYTRLAGHGRSGEALAEASVNDWIMVHEYPPESSIAFIRKRATRPFPSE